jgi:hypothetical protein
MDPSIEARGLRGRDQNFDFMQAPVLPLNPADAEWLNQQFKRQSTS